MRIGYLIDTNLTRPDRRPLTPAEIADGLDAMVEEGILAERAGFHSVHAPDRHAVAATALPGPANCSAARIGCTSVATNVNVASITRSVSRARPTA